MTPLQKIYYPLCAQPLAVSAQKNPFQVYRSCTKPSGGSREKSKSLILNNLRYCRSDTLDPDTDFGSLLVNSELPADSTRKSTNHHLGEGCPKHDSDGSNRKTGPWR